VHHTVQRLFAQGLTNVAVCANGHSTVFSQSFSDWNLPPDALSFYEDRMPRGAAGCVADVARGWGKETLLVMQSNVLVTRPLTKLLSQHRRSRADMTVGVRPAEGEGGFAPAGVYVFEPTVFEFIKPMSYQDVKEQLIPVLTKAGKRVVPFAMEDGYLSWDDGRTYLAAVRKLLADPRRFGLSLGSLRELAPGIFVANSAIIHPTARVFGPVAVLEGASIGSGAVVVGPAIVGAGCNIDSEVTLCNSVLWEHVEVGRRSSVSNSVVGVGVRIGARTSLDSAIAPTDRKGSWLKGLLDEGYKAKRSNGKKRRAVRSYQDGHPGLAEPACNTEAVSVVRPAEREECSVESAR
jgi:mannose-1-phosphate guanylyltransferase